MIEDFLGPAEFRQGLHNFLVKHKYGTAVTKDLMNELSAVSSEGLDVEAIVDTWTRQKGYPVLTLSKAGFIFVRTFFVQKVKCLSFFELTPTF